MDLSNCQEQKNNESGRIRTKRAERAIYRPGAFRLKKEFACRQNELSKKQKNEISNVKPALTTESTTKLISNTESTRLQTSTPIAQTQSQKCKHLNPVQTKSDSLNDSYKKSSDTTSSSSSQSFNSKQKILTKDHKIKSTSEPPHNLDFAASKKHGETIYSKPRQTSDKYKKISQGYSKQMFPEEKLERKVQGIQVTNKTKDKPFKGNKEQPPPKHIGKNILEEKLSNIKNEPDTKVNENTIRKEKEFDRCYSKIKRSSQSNPNINTKTTGTISVKGTFKNDHDSYPTKDIMSEITDIAKLTSDSFNYRGTKKRGSSRIKNTSKTERYKDTTNKESTITDSVKSRTRNDSKGTDKFSVETSKPKELLQHSSNINSENKIERMVSPKSDGTHTFPKSDSKSISPKSDCNILQKSDKLTSPKSDGKIPLKLDNKLTSLKSECKSISPKSDIKLISPKSDNKPISPKSDCKPISSKSDGKPVSPKSDDKAKYIEMYSVSQMSKYIENMDLCPSSEENTSESEDNNEKSKKLVNPMMYIDFEENTFYRGSRDTKSSNIKSKSVYSKSPDSQNITWGDEKWSPAQRQMKKRGKYNKDYGHTDCPRRRGIIQINSSPNADTQADAVITGQRLLFNPNNPSKPLAVMPSARDLPPSWDNSNSAYDKNLEESAVGPNWNESSVETEGSGNLDPSIFYSIQKGELDINYFVGSNQLPQEFRRIMDIRSHLQNCYKQMLISDIRLCQEKNVEGALWKTLYYIIIEKLREYISREPTLKERSLSTLLMIVNEGLVYFQSLLTAIQETFRFSLEAHFEEDLTTLPGTKNRVRHALYSCQKILLSMGDLARYREQYNSNPNYSQAKKWYEMALQVNPKNGRPFNQLAIIAVSQKRSLDVVYYYVRSLTASNPFTSARDSLISMFDDIRRKYESMNSSKNRSDQFSKDLGQKFEDHSRRREGSLRQEIWIRPDSGATNKRTLSQSDPEEEKNASIQELLKLPQEQLMKQFLTRYLHCHGMLFARVGLDHFNAVLTETLDLFQTLLQLEPSKLSATHILQIMAINMFAVDNTQLRDSRLESGYRSAAQDLALLLSQEMFARLAEAMVQQFPGCLNYTPSDGKWGSSPKEEGALHSGPLGNSGMENQRLFQPPLTHFVPAAKVWCDWLLYQSSVWNPPPTSHEISGVDTWGVIGELATIVKGVGPPDVAITSDAPAHFFCPITLPEDVFLRGYAPIITAQVGGYFAPRHVNKERAQDWARVSKFQLALSQFLCGVEPPVLRLQKTDQGEILVSVVAISPPDSPTAGKSSIGSGEVDLEDSNSEAEASNSEDEADLGSSLEAAEDDTPLASTVRLLARRKRVLERRQRQQRKMQAILEGQVTLEMEVKPRYLVPDTNCFIEKLNLIKALIDNTSYTFMVPLIVLAELDGLSRDAAVEKYGNVTHAVNVREGAATALHFVQANKNPRLKCVTSQGSVAPANMFSLEMDTLKDITNDDKILSCCLHLCSDSVHKRPIKEGVRRIHREVVLLTEDRNLRVKAYARDVPVRELTDFAHWAGTK